MSRKTHLRWNVAPLVATVVVASAAGWLWAYLQSGHMWPESEAPGSPTTGMPSTVRFDDVVTGTAPAPPLRVQFRLARIGMPDGVVPLSDTGSPTRVPVTLATNAPGWLGQSESSRVMLADRANLMGEPRASRFPGALLNRSFPADPALPWVAASLVQREQAPQPAESQEGSGGGRKEIFLWVNFLIIIVGFWYLGKKYLGPFLQARAQAIREDMERSNHALQEATRRLSGVEEKLKRLDEEIASLRNSALQEAAAEGAHIAEMAKADASKIALAAEQEIAAAAKLARQDLKVFAAELAVSLAEKKIQESISPQVDRGIFRSFLQDLSSRSGGDA